MKQATLSVVKRECVLRVNVELCFVNFILTPMMSLTNKEHFSCAVHIGRGQSLYLERAWQEFKAGSSSRPSSGRTDSGGLDSLHL